MIARAISVSTLALALVACGGNAEGEAPAATATTASQTVAIPETLAPFGDGYPGPGAPCRSLGESAATVNYLDDSAVLVGCPDEASAASLGGRIVGNVEGVRLVSIPMGDANVGLSETAPPPAGAAPAAPTAAAPAKSPKVAARGPNGLEERCLRRLRKEGLAVVGTNRIEEAESGTAIYVNIDGAQAPWRCLAYSDGTIGEIMFTGSEGDL
jgi:hypothetical protein